MRRHVSAAYAFALAVTAMRTMRRCRAGRFVVELERLDTVRIRPVSLMADEIVRIALNWRGQDARAAVPLQSRDRASRIRAAIPIAPCCLDRRWWRSRS